jgi:hypothetical protein
VSAHTPGPWDIDPASEEDGGCSITANGKTVAWHVSKENAPLIAAAPELLAALRDLEAMAERYRPAGAPIPESQKRARSAIAKATGGKS